MLQITIDCISTSPMTQFWAAAQQYQVEPPPAGFATWNDYWRSIGVGENDLDPHGDGSDSLTANRAAVSAAAGVRGGCQPDH